LRDKGLYPKRESHPSLFFPPGFLLVPQIFSKEGESMHCFKHTGFVLLSLTVLSTSWADSVAQKSTKIAGKEVSASQVQSAVADTVPDEVSESGVQSVSKVKLFGKQFEVTKNSLHYKVSEKDGLSHKTSFTINGKKVLAESFVDSGGSYTQTVDIPAADISGDIVSYSLGILSVGIHTGVSYSGSLNASASSEFLRPSGPSLSSEMNLFQAAVGVDVLAKGYVEGHAKFFIFKAAVGGDINLIDGRSTASINVTPATVTNPEITYDGIVRLLSGDLYAYLSMGSVKIVSHDFYKSKGQCFAFGASSCSN
jgi:hypothetical protein